MTQAKSGPWVMRRGFKGFTNSELQQLWLCCPGGAASTATTSGRSCEREMTAGHQCPLRQIELFVECCDTPCAVNRAHRQGRRAVQRRGALVALFAVYLLDFAVLLGVPPCGSRHDACKPNKCCITSSSEY